VELQMAEKIAGAKQAAEKGHVSAKIPKKHTPGAKAHH
jgi:hypothetical protein